MKDKKSFCYLTHTFLVLSLFGFFVSKALSANMLISRIKIKGNFPIFEKELHRVIDIRIGEDYRPQRVKEVAKKIEGIYKDEGYDGVWVEPQIIEEVDRACVKIVFMIHKGFRTGIGEIVIIDDRPDEPPDIAHFLGFRAGQVFKRKKLRESLEALEKYLVRLGYLNVDIRHLEALKDRTVRLQIFVHRGPKLNVSVKGHQFFSTGRIKDNMSFYENRFFDRLEVEESIQRIKDLYLDEGFLDAAVNVQWEEDKGENKDSHIVFKIIEGPRTCLKDIQFENNTHIKDKRLRRQFLSMRSLSLFRPRAFKALTFAEDLKAVEALYRSEGFPNVKISTQTQRLDNGCIRKRIILNEGIQLRVRKPLFSGNRAFSDTQLCRVLEVLEGSPLYTKAVQEDRQGLRIFYANYGYPYAKISVTEKVDDKSGLADISYQIDEGPMVRFGKLIISRNLKTRQKAIRLACTFKEGEPFSYQKILDTQERLSNLGLFRSLSVEPKGLEERQEHVDCLIEVEEMASGQINFGAGFSSREGYRGYLELREDNLWGRAVSGGVRADFSGLGRNYDLVDEIGRSSKYTITFKDPLFIPRHKVEGEGKLYTMTQDRKEYHTRSHGLRLGIWRPYKRKKLRVGLTYHIDLNRLNDITIDPNVIPEKYEEHTISAIGPTIIYDSRDNFIDPHKGIYSNISLDFAGGWIGGDQNFYKLQGEFRGFLPLSSKLVMALSLRGGYIGLYGNTNRVPIQERFFSGGGNTVRGFKEDSLGPMDSHTGLPLGGRVFWVNNAELRYPLYKSIKGIIFFDAGNVWATRQEVRTEDLRHSAGVGLRWMTPIGPIRLDYGMAIDRKPQEPKSRAYLSIGHAF